MYAYPTVNESVAEALGRNWNIVMFVLALMVLYLLT
jgi:hypothetical protein